MRDSGKRTWCAASAPGTLMLMGEHAVLRGEPALVCATDQRICVVARREGTRQIRVQSALGHAVCPPGRYADIPASLRFVQAVLERAELQEEAGMSISIESDFSSTVGLGSSAAVTVALCAALRGLWGAPADPGAVFREALGIIRAVQGCGSGADVAAAVLGGLVRYRAGPLEMDTLPISLPLTLVYCGYKRPTPEVIALVNEAEEREPERYAAMFRELGELAEKGWEAARGKNWQVFGELMNKHQVIMERMNLSTPEIREILAVLQSADWSFGAKISGSGLGDCVLALGCGDWPLKRYTRIPVVLSERGLEVNNDA